MLLRNRRYLRSREAQRARADQKLRDFLLMLGREPVTLDRFIFDPEGTMARHGLSDAEQRLLMTGSVDDINANIWPTAVPTRGRAFSIEIIELPDGTSEPLVRGVMPTPMPRPSWSAVALPPLGPSFEPASGAGAPAWSPRARARRRTDDGEVDEGDPLALLRNRLDWDGCIQVSYVAADGAILITVTCPPASGEDLIRLVARQSRAMGLRVRLATKDTDWKPSPGLRLDKRLEAESECAEALHEMPVRLDPRSRAIIKTLWDKMRARVSMGGELGFVLAVLSSDSETNPEDVIRVSTTTAQLEKEVRALRTIDRHRFRSAADDALELNPPLNTFERGWWRQVGAIAGNR